MKLAFASLIAILLSNPIRAHACSCIPPPPPLEALGMSSDVFLALVSDVEGPYPVPAGDNSYTDSDVVVRLRVLASWKGAKRDTITLTTGAGGGDCGYEFMIGGVYIVYGSRDKAGGLHTFICSRTAPMERAREDSIALGTPAIDRLHGKSWNALAPPSICPVHGEPICVSHSWVTGNLAPAAERIYPGVAAREFPFAAMPLYHPPPGVNTRGGRTLHQAYVCPLCREAAAAWCMVRQDDMSTLEQYLDLPFVPGRPGNRTQDDYAQEYANDAFAVSYGDGRYDYDSIDGRFSRGFGGVRDTSFKFTVSATELGRIYQATVGARLFDLPGPHPAYPLARLGTPVRADRACKLYVRCGTTVRQFSWHPERAPRDAAPDSDWGRLMGVYRGVQRLLANRPELATLTLLPAALDDPLRDRGKP